MSSKKHKRYRLLLDEGLYLPNSYPKLNNLHNVLHVAQTRLKGKPDKYVYKAANKDKRVPIVHNTKHFLPLILAGTVSVISLSTNLSNEEADLKICKALRVLNPSESKGHLISISNQGIVVKRMI